MSLLPGNPVALTAHADDLITAASLLEQAATDMRNLVLDSQSKAVDATEAKTTETSTALTEAGQRYRDTGIALREYSVVLKQAQDSADAADSVRNTAGYEEQRARNSLHSQRTQVDALRDSGIPQHQILQAEQQLNDLYHQQRAANQRAQEATEQIEQARRDVDAAAQVAITKINSAIKQTNDGVLDKLGSFFDDLGEMLAAVGRWITEVLAKVLEVLVEILKVVAIALLVIIAIIALVALIYVALQLLVVILASAIFKILVSLVLLTVGAILIWEATRPPLDVRPYETPSLEGKSGEELLEARKKIKAGEVNAALKDRHLQDINDLMDSVRYIDQMGTTDTAVLDIKNMGGEPPNWVVTIPSTQDFMGGAPNDWAHNVPLKLLPWYQTQFEKAILQAMAQAGIQPGDPVALFGFSQGGILSARLAANEDSGFNITRVVTVGSPVHDIAIPPVTSHGDPVEVVTLRHQETGLGFWKSDPVPALEVPFIRYSDAPHFHTYTPPVPDGVAFFNAHDAELYSNSMKNIRAENPHLDDLFSDFYGKPESQVQFQLTE